MMPPIKGGRDPGGANWCMCRGGPGGAPGGGGPREGGGPGMGGPGTIGRIMPGGGGARGMVPGGPGGMAMCPMVRPVAGLMMGTGMGCWGRTWYWGGPAHASQCTQDTDKQTGPDIRQ